MALFSRFGSKRKRILPKEVGDYYNLGRREHKGIAFLLGLATLVGTLLVAALIFVVVRTVYRVATGDSSNQTAKVQTDKPQPKDQDKDKTDKPKTTDSSEQGVIDAQGYQAKPNTSGPPRVEPRTTPALGDGDPAPATLPRTGDEGM